MDHHGKKNEKKRDVTPCGYLIEGTIKKKIEGTEERVLFSAASVRMRKARGGGVDFLRRGPLLFSEVYTVARG